MSATTALDTQDLDATATDLDATVLDATDLVDDPSREKAATRTGTVVAPVGDGETLSIAEVAARTGVTAHTLRYYERIGLLTVPRDQAGHRAYTRDEVGRVVFITRLRLTAMPIRDIQAYFALVAEGPGNEDRRLALLEAHRDQVKARLADLESALGVIEFKITTYGGTCAP